MSTDRQAARAGSFAERLNVPGSLTYPGAHLGLTWRMLGPADTEAVMALDARCEPVDRPTVRRREPNMRLLLGEGTTEHRHEVLGGEDDAGELRAVGIVTVLAGCERELIASLEAFVDPAWRGRGIGRALFDWQDGRARQILAEDGRDLPVAIESRTSSHATERRRLLAAAGFSPDRTVEQMVRTIGTSDRLCERVRATCEEAGVDLIAFEPSLVSHIRAVYNRACAEHLGGRFLVESDARRLAAAVDPELSVVAVTRGENPIVVGFLLARERDDISRDGHCEAWIDAICTERGWRTTGIGDAMLGHHLAVCRSRNLPLSGIDVDASRTPAFSAWLARNDFFPRTTDIVYTIEI